MWKTRQLLNSDNYFIRARNAQVSFAENTQININSLNKKNAYQIHT